MEPNERTEAESENQDETPEQASEELSDGEYADDIESNPEMAFSWEASEFVHHHKSPLWYVVLILAVIILVSFSVWLKLWLEIGLFVIMAVAIVVYARKPPRTLLYELSADGLHIDGRLYPFEYFRSFSVISDTEWHSIDLEPVKRLSPRVTVLFDTEDFDQIVDHFELHLPREDRDPDMIERISRYVRF